MSEKRTIGASLGARAYRPDQERREPPRSIRFSNPLTAAHPTPRRAGRPAPPATPPTDAHLTVISRQVVEATAGVGGERPECPAVPLAEKGERMTAAKGAQVPALGKTTR